jgi:hypothetical protein
LVATALSIAFVTMAAFYGVMFVQSLYFQQVRGQSPLVTGLLFLPMTGLVGRVERAGRAGDGTVRAVADDNRW